MFRKNRKKSGQKPQEQAAKPQQSGKPQPKQPSPQQPAGGKQVDKSRQDSQRQAAQQRQKKPQKITPQEMVQKLLRTFPPEINQIQEFLRNCRGIQTAIKNGLLEPPDADELFYLIASSIETLAEDKLDRLFDSGYREPLQKMRADAGLEEHEFFKPNDSRIPEEYTALLSEFKEKKRALLAALLREQGQPDSASLILENHHEYLARKHRGRQLFLSRNPLLKPYTLDDDDEAEEAESPEENPD